MSDITPPGYQRIDVHISGYGSDRPREAVLLEPIRQAFDGYEIIQKGWAVPVPVLMPAIARTA